MGDSESICRWLSLSRAPSLSPSEHSLLNLTLATSDSHAHRPSPSAALPTTVLGPGGVTVLNSIALSHPGGPQLRALLRPAARRPPGLWSRRHWLALRPCPPGLPGISRPAESFRLVRAKHVFSRVMRARGGGTSDQKREIRDGWGGARAEEKGLPTTTVLGPGGVTVLNSIALSHPGGGGEIGEDAEDNGAH